ncbi:expressed unknown protein [Seminavis robusta]|uniref:Uncharacterized protein n=1 Tax=Seminavis robusta TaxID=568900 RepID=A0A9N8HWS1_9STRA|nr:expressed unknown protein [Seminavis robusta]|eukprot:Sro1691_g291411.1  (523) ;mRNA; r:4623-6191
MSGVSTSVISQSLASPVDDRDTTSMDHSALFAALDDPVPTTNWTVSKHQLLEMVLMAKADLETVKTFYGFFPEALTKQLFRNVLKCGAKPGVVGFLATIRPDLVDDNAFVFAVNQGPGPNRPTDKEIVTMANINPEMLMPTGQNYVMSNCLCSVLNWKYSLELTQSLFKMIAGKTKEIEFPCDFFNDIDIFPWVVVDENASTKRASFDKEALKGMDPMLDSTNLQNVLNWCGNWELDAFLEFLRKVLSNVSLCNLFLLNFPEPSQDQEGKPSFFASESFNQVLSKCKIQKLRISVKQNDPLALEFMKCCLIRMPSLKHLSVCVDSDIAASKATPVIGHILRSNSQFDTLTIRATSDATGKGLDPILSALENNQTLESFNYRQGGAQPERFKRYQDILAVVLQSSNETLGDANFSDGCTDEDPRGNLRSGLHPSEHLLPFYTALNWIGRKEAGDPETTIANFVCLLAGVTVKEGRIFFDEDRTHNPATTEDISNILYGLLRENPAIWSKHTKSGSKRKHCVLS